MASSAFRGDHETVPVPGSAPLIGREASLDELRAAVSHAADGSPSVVLLTGETGAGKSRLVSELTSSDDVVVLYGACLPIAGEPLPFAPLTQVLHDVQHRPCSSGALVELELGVEKGE